jgi:ERCC4-type nuclease
MYKINWKVYVDFRERHENSSDKNAEVFLKKYEVPYELTHLSVGDYVCENLDNGQKICIERKIISDFVGSIYDGRLTKEILQMEQSFVKSFVIIVGDWKEFNRQQSESYTKGFLKRFFTEEQKTGVFASINSRYQNVRLIQANDDKEFCVYLKKLLEKSTDGRVLGEMMVVRKKTKELQYFNLLTSFPNLGADKAKLIMDMYPSFKIFYSNVINKTFEVKGIGKKTLEGFEEEFL